MRNRATAQVLAEEVFEANLPDGLYLNNAGRLYYYCPRCEGETDWECPVEQFPDAEKLCGSTQWCIP